MSDSAAPTSIDFTTQLPADAYSQLIRTLCLTLPPPLSNNPDDLAQHNHAVIARIAALTPANAAKADLAALYVAAFEQWKECLRLAQRPDISEGWAMKCRAQANSMMRQGQSALRLLLRMQAARRTIEANSADSDRAAWTEHCAIGLMAEALSPEPEKAAPILTTQSMDAFATPPPRPLPQGEGEWSTPASPPLAGGVGEGVEPSRTASGMTGPRAPESLAEVEPVARPESEPVAGEAGASTSSQRAARLGPPPVRFANRPRIRSGAGSRIKSGPGSLPHVGGVSRGVRYSQATSAFNGMRLNC